MKDVQVAMQNRWSLIPWIFGVGALSALALGFLDRAAAVSTAGDVVGGLVVLELFTSQGCSSCPPADLLLSQIGSSAKGVIPLAYHVDYWNHLGWSDPFSSHEFSERQSAYARVIDLGGEYTPQAVIEGSSQCVGSDGRSIWRAIDAARSSSDLGRVGLHASLSGEGPRTLRIKVSAQSPKVSAAGGDRVMVAIFENGLVTKIGAGENAGRQITYDYTVRKLLPALDLDSARSGSVEKQLTVDVDPSWSVDHLGVAAFIQDSQSLRILGAASQYPVAKDQEALSNGHGRT